MIYLITQDGYVLDSFATAGTPYGVTWDGSYLWYTVTDINWVYQVDVNFTAVEPASLGNVKAIYR